MKKQKKIDFEYFDRIRDLENFLNRIGKERIVQILHDKTYQLYKYEDEGEGYRLEEDDRWIVFYEK